jgi:hypothetical protein
LVTDGHTPADFTGPLEETERTNLQADPTVPCLRMAIMMTQALADDVNSSGLPDGIERSLIAKLDGGAMDFMFEALSDRANGDNASARRALRTAEQKLASFINEVGALAGKQIDSLTAARFIEQARAIIVLLEQVRAAI